MVKWTEAPKAEVEFRILKILNGFQYLLKLVSNEAPKMTIKDINDKPCKVYPIKFYLVGIQTSNQKAVDNGIKTDFSAYMSVINLETEEVLEYDLDLTPNFYNHLRSFVMKKDITTKDTFTLERIGAEFWTKYLFVKVKLTPKAKPLPKPIKEVK